MVSNGKENRMICIEYKRSFNMLAKCWSTICDAGSTLNQLELVVKNQNNNSRICLNRFLGKRVKVSGLLND